MEIILASNNKEKLREITHILQPFGIKVISQAESGFNIEVEETGKTFAENAILKAIEDGAEMVFCTGGMSVDPDDRTPGAIKATGAEIVSYGAPVLPGAMFLVSYYYKDGKEIPVCGLPGCVMYGKRTIFDLLLPRLIAGEKLSMKDMAEYGHGGLCENCPVCTFPKCGFGK